MRWIELTEKRRNPSLNKKTNILDELKKYQGNSKVFVSFVEDVGAMSHEYAGHSSRNASGHKIGINPSSGYNTPNGIYCYPIDYAIELIETKDTQFAMDRPFAYVIESIGNLIVSSEYTDSELEFDIYQLAMEYGFDEEDGVNSGAKVDTPSGKLWSLTRNISLSIKNDSKHMNVWSSIFRNIGYSGFYDDTGLGIVHENEPTQCVFFSKSSFKVLETITNREGGNGWMKQAKAIPYLIKTGKIDSKQAAEWIIDNIYDYESFSKLQIPITPQLTKELSKQLINSIHSVPVYVFENLLKFVPFTEEDIYNILIDNDHLLKKMEILSLKPSNDLKNKISNYVIRNNKAGSIAFLLDSGWITLDKAMPVIDYAYSNYYPLSLSPHYWKEVAKKKPHYVERFPLDMFEFVPDKIVAEYASNRLANHGTLYSKFGPKTLMTVAKDNPRAMVNAVINGSYIPSLYILKKIFPYVRTEYKSGFLHALAMVKPTLLKNFMKDHMDNPKMILSVMRVSSNDMKKYLLLNMSVDTARDIYKRIDRDADSDLYDLLKAKIGE